jgi:L-aspartate oxidase
MSQTISQSGERFYFDVLVFGSGIAGLSYVLELSQLQPNCKIALISKSKLTQSNTYYAQGGIAAVYNPHTANCAAAPRGEGKEDTNKREAQDTTEDSVASHVADTLAAGDQLCNCQTVEMIVQQGAASIDYLLAQGVAFDHNEQNELACGKEGGHSKRRIYHCGDQTGAVIAETLIQKLDTLNNVLIFEHHIAINLITQHNEVIGAYVFDEASGVIHSFFAHAVILATGGSGRVYRYTSNPDVATGDGLAMAYRAGAKVSDLEFYQFHPTLLYHPTVNHFLISEALRGEGAYLRLPSTGERFMKKYAPEQMELATRDVVARAIFCEIERSNNDYVHLDIRHKDKAYLQKRFPMIYQTLLKLGLDLSCDLIPVVPAAHYMCGGIVSDTSGHTSLKRLYAIGETACAGFHGANRLASNSLLEGLVMGRKAAAASLQDIIKPVVLQHAIPSWDSTCVEDLRRASQIHTHWRGLRGEMTSYAGIIRTAAGLRDQLQLILTRKEMIEEYYWKYAISRDLIELRNIILVAELIVHSALLRNESRGGHFREDYPEKNLITENSRI